MSRRPTARAAVAELAEPFELDLGAADLWHLFLLWRGRPFERLVIPGPGHASPALADALVGHHRDRQAQREALVSQLRERMRFPAPEPPPLRVSVVVCTHRRPELVAELLRRLAELDPAPFEILVVDNDPGQDACRAEAEALGAVYLVEPRRGLNVARGTGFAAASGDVVAFIDDDCRPPAGWLQAMPELYANPHVASVTGPAFPSELETPAQLKFEEADGFSRGLRRREVEWTGVPPVKALAAGAGANMSFRRSVLLGLGGELFPPALDAGTPTRSGGDFYLLYRVLAAGFRIVYSPQTWVLHRHRPSHAELIETIEGYGIGLSATLTKLVRDHGELEAPTAWTWLVRQWLGTTARRLAGAGDPVAQEIVQAYVRGGLKGPQALRESEARANPATNASQPALLPTPLPPYPGNQDAPEARSISIVIPTRGRPQQLRRCLEALAAAGAPGAAAEVVVADDNPPGHELAPLPEGVIHIRCGGIGAAGARNQGAAAATGELLLFMDDDLEAEPGLIEAHRAAHAGTGDTVVIGYSPPRPPEPGLADMLAAAWWEDHFHQLRDARPLFTSMLSGNVSVPRGVWDRVGTYDERYGPLRREDWEWGVRALEAAVDVTFEPHAVAAHAFRLTTRAMVEAAEREGAGDALLLERNPALATGFRRRPGRLVLREGTLGRRLAFPLFLLRPARSAAIPVLDALERARLRSAWWWLFKLVEGAAYETGIHRAGPPRYPVHAVELTSSDPVPEPHVAAPLIEPRIRGERLPRVWPQHEKWHPLLANQIASGLEEEHWALLDQPKAAPDPGVRVVDCADWRHVNEVLAADESTLVIRMPGTTAPAEAVAPLLAGLDGEHVALVTGSARDGPGASPLALGSALTRPVALRRLTTAPRLIALNPLRVRELGGFDPSLARFGPQAPVLDLVERAVTAGFVIGQRQVPGVGDAGTARAEHQMARARGALAALHRNRTPGQLSFGVLLLVQRMLRPEAYGRAEQLRRSAAFARGALQALRS